jgi:hypothetical protein
MRKTLLALTALLASTASLADTLVDNANGIQVDDAGRIQRFDGLLIGDDGKVKQLFRSGQQRPAADNRIDAQGRTLLPGLVDGHGHVMSLGFAALQLDLTGTRSIAELQQRLRDYAAANPDAIWILGRGWNQELWSDKRFPTAADLDAVVSDRPVWLGRVDGHAAVANSAALKAARVTSVTKAPEGGRIENGLFVDAAMGLVDGKVPAPSAADFDRALAKAQELMLSVGITSAADMGSSPADWAAFDRAGSAGRLNVRIMSYAGGIPAMRAINGGQPSGWLHGDRLHLGGVKLYSDGALGSRGAWLKASYHDMPGTRGLSLLTPQQVDEQVGEASRSGYQIAIHAIGDAANAMVLDAYGKARLADRRPRVEHAQIVDPADAEKFRRFQVIASMQPTHQTSDRVMAEARLGPDRLDGAYAWNTLEKLGVKLAFGSDFPVESPNPFPGLSAAISRQDVSGQPAGGWRPEERVSLGQALHGFTRGASYAGFAESRIGALETGKWADFIIVDRDITKIDAKALARTGVLESWVAGSKVWARLASAGAGERGR